MIYKLRRWLTAMLLLVVCVTTGAIEVVPTFAKPQLEVRYLQLVQELRCLVCQNQAVADSNASLARDLRQQVARMLNDGKSNEEIYTFMTERYGEFILLTPRIRGNTLLLYLAPVLLLGGGAFMVMALVRRRHAVPTTNSASARLEQVRRELNDPH